MVAPRWQAWHGDPLVGYLRQPGRMKTVTSLLSFYFSMASIRLRISTAIPRTKTVVAANASRARMQAGSVILQLPQRGRLRKIVAAREDSEV